MSMYPAQRVRVESEAEAERQLRLTIDRDGVVVPFCPLVESETKAERQIWTWWAYSLRGFFLARSRLNWYSEKISDGRSLF